MLFQTRTLHCHHISAYLSAMLDATLRPLVDILLNSLGRRVGRLLTANQVTIIGFVFGVAAVCSCCVGNFEAAFYLLIVNRVCDGIDGAVARHHGLTDIGGFLDIVLDFVIYAGIPFGFAVFGMLNAGTIHENLFDHKPKINLRHGGDQFMSTEEGLIHYVFPAAFLIFSFVGTIATFLAYAVIAEKRKAQGKMQESLKRGKKSFHYLGGLCEGTETITALLLMCLFPKMLALICYAYGTMCHITTMSRIVMAYYDFSDALQEKEREVHGE